MVRRLWRDDTGMALGLAVIMVLLIGVMAAGFLALVRNDIEATISTNQSQRAFVLADAGAQAGASRLRSDANPEHYDATAAENAEWAYVSPNGGAPGKVLPLDAGTARVTIRHLRPATLPTHPRNESRAPEPVPAGSPDYANRDFFAIVSDATSGASRRKVETIVYVVTTDGPREVEQWSWRETYE